MTLRQLRNVSFGIFAIVALTGAHARAEADRCDPQLYYFPYCESNRYFSNECDIDGGHTVCQLYCEAGNLNASVYYCYDEPWYCETGGRRTHCECS